MNIFYLDRDPVIAAQSQCDKHVVKMIVESVQLMATAHHVLDAPYAMTQGIKPTHVNHPCAKWVRASHANYMWLAVHADALSNEYTRRYNKVHAYAFAPIGVIPHIIGFQLAPLHIPTTPFTDPPQCMPDEYKRVDTIEAYRAYYIGDKKCFAKWKYTKQPEWFE